MHCTVCSSTLTNQISECLSCGCPPEPAMDWGRRAEALAFEELHAALERNEELLGMTRGKLTARPSSVPQDIRSFLTGTGFCNVGLSSERLLIQRLSGGDPQTVVERTRSWPLTEIGQIRVEETNPDAGYAAVRLRITFLQEGEARIRAYGRLVGLARDLLAVWQTICVEPPQDTPLTACPQCGRSAAGAAHYCPYCGMKRQGESN